MPVDAGRRAPRLLARSLEPGTPGPSARPRIARSSHMRPAVRSRLVSWRTRFVVVPCALAGALALVAPASASQLIARNASNIELAVNAKGTAMVTYSVRGKVTPPPRLGRGQRATPAGEPPDQADEAQARLLRRLEAPEARLEDLPERLPALRRPRAPWLVSACKAPNGSYWALQTWQTALPNLGMAPWLSKQKTWWLHLSHWTGDLPKLEVYTDWVYSGRFQEVFGRYTYNGVGVRGFGTTNYGDPTDGYGRLLYLDTYNSSYGPGWLRENSFVSHGPPGMFCYGFFPHNPWVGGYAHPPGDPEPQARAGNRRAVPDHGRRPRRDA